MSEHRHRIRGMKGLAVARASAIMAERHKDKTGIAHTAAVAADMATHLRDDLAAADAFAREPIRLLRSSVDTDQSKTDDELADMVLDRLEAARAR